MELHIPEMESQLWRAPPQVADWMDPQFAAIQGSVVNIQRHWCESLRAGTEPGTSGADNLRTLELVQAAYESAAKGGELVGV